MKRHSSILRLSALLLFSWLALAQAQIQIMPLGDSITKGAVDPGPSLSGYRARLFDDLQKAQVKYRFIGCTTNNSNSTMMAAGQGNHNGYGSYRIDELFKNLAGVQGVGNGDDNKGGYWLTGGHGTSRGPAYPDLVLLLGGTNDLGQKTSESDLEKRMTDLLTWFKTNRPKALLFVATVPPCGPDKEGHETFNAGVVAFNRWLAQAVPALGANFHLVDFYALFVDPSGQVKRSDTTDGIFLQDGIHPSHNGYVAMGDAWFKAITPFLPPDPDAVPKL